jgi:exopolysaccharide biosynthesis polyprenyl glycosylphosphotransferase
VATQAPIGGDERIRVGTEQTGDWTAGARGMLDYQPAPFSLARRQGLWRDALLRRMLALADLGAAVGVSVSLGLFATGRVHFALWSAVFAPAWVVLAKLNGLYDCDQRSLRHLTVDELPRLLIWALISTGLLTVFLALTPAGDLPVGIAARTWVVASVLAFTFRSIARVVWRQITPPERTLIVGEGPLAVATHRKLVLFPDIHVSLVAERPELTVDQLHESPDYLGSVDRVIIASSAIDEQLIAELVAYCRRRQIKLSLVPPARGMFGTAVQLNHVADLPIVEYNTWDVSRSTLLLKRALDVTVSLTALVVFAPLFFVIAAAIATDSRGPVFFTQTRAGLHRGSFRMFKFRTMVKDAEELLAGLVPFDKLRDPMFKLTRDPRVTRVGRVLRRTSLDELPQLLNVLRGDMSLVGPRPEQVELVDRYEPAHMFRLAVKPGLTGPMQVYGRGQLTFEERLAVEREYVDNLSVGRDVRILTLTLPAVLSGRGAY